MVQQAAEKRAVFTICSWNYLAYASTLAESFRRHNPDTPFFVFIADRPQPLQHVLGETKIIVVDGSVVPDYERMAACYSIMEFNTSVKPHCFEFLFDKHGFEQLCYIDPDIFVTASLSEIFRILAEGDDCVLTPHITAPLSDGLVPGDLEIARSGIFNLGFAAFRNSSSARAFLSWWRGWLETDCLVDFERGIFVDQSFCDFAPVFMERVHILRDPGYNLAYWNLLHRPVEDRDGKLFAGGSPVKFVHFSGVDKDRPEAFSKHQNRFTRETLGALRPLFEHYVETLRSKDMHGELRFSQVEYGFGRLNSGVPIIPAMRACFRRYYQDIPAGQSPFDVDRGFFTAACDRPRLRPLVNRLVAELYHLRPDLQDWFLLRAPEDRMELNRLAETILPEQYKLGEAWAVCDESNDEIPSQFFQSAVARLPTPLEINRLVKLFGFYVGDRLASLFRPRQKMDDLAWSLAYSFELLTPGFRKSLVESLEIDSNPSRLALFRHWMQERGFAAESWRGESAPRAASPQQSKQDGLAVYGFLNAETGLGQAGRALATAFKTTQLPMSCHAVPAPGHENTVPFEASPSMKNSAGTALLAMNADNVMNLQHHMNPAVLAQNRRIGLFFWELPVFPGVWAGACEQVDEVWVSSRFVRDSLQSTTSKPVHIVPLPVPLNDLDAIQSRRALGLPLDRLLYLVTFDFNSFPERKNPMGALRAFLDAFPKATESSPLLVVKCHGARNRAAYEKELGEAIARNPHMMLIDRVMTAQEMLQLQAATDVYVSLHRAEGFGLNLAESMAAGKVAIGTNFSGNVDFMNAQNSLLVDFDMRPVRDGEYVAWQGQWWAAPRHDDAVSALRLAESSSALRGQLGEAARRHVASALSSESVGRTMADLIMAGPAGRA